MTDADEALLWAREDLAKKFELFKPYISETIRNGAWDNDVAMRASVIGYRAAAAASAERIKELEVRVAELEAEVEDLRATNEALALPEGSVLISSFDWSPPVAKRPDQ